MPIINIYASIPITFICGAHSFEKIVCKVVLLDIGLSDICELCKLTWTQGHCFWEDTLLLIFKKYLFSAVRTGRKSEI